MIKFDETDEGYLVIHSPSEFILRHYWDIKKARQMSSYLDSLAPEGDRLFDQDIYQRIFHILYQKIFVNFHVSGVNTKNEMSGFIFHNQSICTTAGISKPAFEYLLSVGRDPKYTGKVFMDSGAFGEVNADLSIKKEMTDKDWQKIFDRYEALAKVFGDRLTVMAPDRVGDQEVTMQRLEKYKNRIKKVASYGCKIMGAIQKNPTVPNSLYLFHERMNNFFQSIGIKHWVRGLPLNKSPVKISDVEYMIQNAEPFRYIHLLGKSPYAKDYNKWEAMLSKYPQLDITCDASIFRRIVGEGKPLTELEREIRPILGGDFKRLENSVLENLQREFDEGDYVDFSGFQYSDWFDHDVVKEALVESLKSNPRKTVPMPRSWLLKGNNLTKLAFLDVNLSLPYDLFEYTEKIGMTPEELENLELGLMPDGEIAETWEEEKILIHKYWDAIFDLYVIYRSQGGVGLPYETYGTYFYGARDGYSLFPDEFREAVKLDALLNIIGKSTRALAVKLLAPEERGKKEGRLIVNPLIVDHGIMRDR